jgi:peptidoglycan/LPS O-acetylase OafA/YrhL
VSAKQPTAAHFDSIDTLRTIAALSVCFFHFTYFIPKESWWYIVFKEGYLGVDAFYVISGFVVPYSLSVKRYQIRQFFSFVLKRFIRIEPAYWVSILLMISKDAIARLYIDYRYFQLPPYEPYNLLIHFFHLNDIVQEPYILGVQLYWTLAIDWQFFLFGALFFFFINQRQWWARYAFYAAYIAICWQFPVEQKQWLFFWGLLFLPGIVYYHYTMGYMSRIELLILWTIILGLIYKKMWWNHFGATTLSCLVVFFLTQKWSVTAFIGKISYSLYLTHIVSGWWFLTGIALMVKNTTWMPFWVIIGILISIVFAYVNYRYVEAPTQHWARRIK